jgi:hypothetical protein
MSNVPINSSKVSAKTTEKRKPCQVQTHLMVIALLALAMLVTVFSMVAIAAGPASADPGIQYKVDPRDQHHRGGATCLAPLCVS